MSEETKAPARDEKAEQYFEAMKQLWDYPPFQQWLKIWTDQAENIGSVEQAKSESDLYFRKGQLNVIRNTQNLRANIEVLESEYLKSLEPDDDEEPTGDLYE